jgi:PhzF family phenazine biosynthesis protein
MKRFKFKKMNAFASGLSTGNPAAAVYLDSFNDISEHDMLRIARELKGFVSEVVYIAEIGPNKYRLRYFSSEKEVEFCGHATIAVMYDLLKQQGGQLQGQHVQITTNKGVLDVENRISDEDSVFITAPVPRFNGNKIFIDEICAATNIRAGAIDRKMPVGIVNAGNETLCVPIQSLDDIVSMLPDYDTLRSFCHKHKLDVVTVFTKDVADTARACRTRVFAAPFGYLEDPATGSGNAALGYHLLRHKLWDGGRIILEQNNDKQNPNIVKMGTKPDADGSIRVIFGGAARMRIEGHYLL